MVAKKPLLPVADARARILKGIQPLGGEMVSLGDAHGRILAQTIRAKRHQPPFAASAMDGYAVRHEDTAKIPITLDLIGQSAAGKSFDGTVKTGQAVRILTGAPVPRGADAVVIQEDTSTKSGKVTVKTKANTCQFIRPSGLDFKRGDIVLEQGTRLQARHIGVAAAANAARLKVQRKPKVTLIGTGNELVSPGEKPGPDQIVSSNNAALSAAIASFGGQAVDLGIVCDDLNAIKKVIKSAAKADVVITIGGASVGDHDLVQDALKASGIKLDFWRIAMRPGKPLMFARSGKQSILGLPGNPVSALVCARIFVKPLIDALLGHYVTEQYLTATLTSGLPANDERQDYLRAIWHRNNDGKLAVTPFSRQDSSMQNILAHANCLIIRAPHAPAARKGTKVRIVDLEF